MWLKYTTTVNGFKNIYDREQMNNHKIVGFGFGLGIFLDFHGFLQFSNSLGWLILDLLGFRGAMIFQFWSPNEILRWQLSMLNRRFSSQNRPILVNIRCLSLETGPGIPLWYFWNIIKTIFSLKLEFFTKTLKIHTESNVCLGLRGSPPEGATCSCRHSSFIAQTAV